MLQNDVLRGAQRNYYSVRIIALCVSGAVLAAAIVAIVASLLISNNTSGVNYDSLVKSCLRGNDVRRESNERIKQHALDAANLQRLARRLSENRQREAAGFAAISGAIPPEAGAAFSSRIDHLVKVLHHASAEDQAIADSQQTVHFAALPIVPCRKIIQKP